VKEVSIINSVPGNSGDLALLEALVYFLQENTSSVSINIFSSAPSIIENAQLKPSLNFFDIDKIYIQDSKGKFESIIKKIYLKFSSEEAMLTNPFLFKSSKKLWWKAIQWSDYVVACPGGYLNEYYEIGARLRVLENIVKKGSKLLFIGHSVGPFFTSNITNRIQEVFKKSEAVVFRESISFDRFKHVDMNSKFCPDIAFLLYKKYKDQLQQHKAKNNKVVVNFRNWQYEKGGEDIIKKAAETLDYINKELDLDVDFLSTCQGLKDYTSDVKMAYIIKEKIRDPKRFNIIDGYHSPKQLIDKYAQYRFYVGMRMHGAILSLIANTPAFLIGYEKKSEGLFNDLKLEDYHVSMEESADTWISRFKDVYERNLNESFSFKDQLIEVCLNIENTLKPLIK